MSTITLTSEQLKKAELVLRGIPYGLVYALVPAINRTAEHAETTISREIRKVYTVKHATVRKHITIVRATDRHPSAELVIKGQRTSLSDYTFSPHRTTGKRPEKGVYAKVRQDGGGYLPHAFVISRTYKHGSQLYIFGRVGADRYPIKSYWSRSVPELIEESGPVHEVVANAITAMLEKRLNHEVNRVLNNVAVANQRNARNRR